MAAASWLSYNEKDQSPLRATGPSRYVACSRTEDTGRFVSTPRLPSMLPVLRGRGRSCLTLGTAHCDRVGIGLVSHLFKVVTRHLAFALDIADGLGRPPFTPANNKVQV